MTDLSQLKASLIAEIDDYVTDFERAGQVAIQFGKAQKRAGDQLKKNTTGFDNAVGKLKKFAVAGAAAAATLAGIGVTAKKAWDSLKAGAELLLVEERFNRLAASIGTTGDALKIKLSGAIRGMMTDAEALDLATTLMSLGLAKSADEATRLTRIAAALKMPLNDLILTLTNQRTMRFDQLGVKVDGFNERLNKLKGTMSDQDAFKMAFLAQAEAQISLVGDAADSAVGDIIRLENEWGNLVNEMKLAAAESAGPAIARINDEIEANKKLKEAYEAGAISKQRYNELFGMLAQVDPSTIYKMAEFQLSRYNETMSRQNDLTWQYTETTSYAADSTWRYSQAQQRAQENAIKGAQTQRDLVAEMEATAGIMETLVGATGNLDGAFGNNTSMAQNMIKEWDWAQAGGQDLENIISTIGGLQVEPEVKRDLLEQALAAAVELDISLNNLTEKEGQAILKDALDLTSLEAAKALLSDGQAGILDDLESLNGAIYTAETDIIDYTAEIRADLLATVSTWEGFHYATFVASYQTRGAYIPTGGGGGGSGDEDTDLSGATALPAAGGNHYHFYDNLALKKVEEIERQAELNSLLRIM